MEKIERWKSNKDVDPEYPFYSRRDEDGTIYYSVPLEAPNDIPVDADDEDAEKYEYSYLPLLGGKNLRVYCWETTDREWALRVRSMINTQHSQDRRYAERFTAVSEVMGDGINDGNRKKSHALCDEPEDPDENDVQEEAESERKKQNGYEQHGWPDVEKQATDRVYIDSLRSLVESKDPKYWSLFCRVEVNGEEKKDVGAELGITPQRVGQLAAKVREIAVKYRRENPD